MSILIDEIPEGGAITISLEEAAALLPAAGDEEITELWLVTEAVQIALPIEALENGWEVKLEQFDVESAGEYLISRLGEQAASGSVYKVSVAKPEETGEGEGGEEAALLKLRFKADALVGEEAAESGAFELVFVPASSESEVVPAAWQMIEQDGVQYIEIELAESGYIVVVK